MDHTFDKVISNAFDNYKSKFVQSISQLKMTLQKKEIGNDCDLSVKYTLIYLRLFLLQLEKIGFHNLTI